MTPELMLKMVEAAVVADERMKREEEYWSYEEVLRAALKAIEEAGWVVVPREPTEAMLISGGREGNWHDNIPSAQYEIAGKQFADEVYRAMIAAAGQKAP